MTESGVHNPYTLRTHPVHTADNAAMLALWADMPASAQGGGFVDAARTLHRAGADEVIRFCAVMGVDLGTAPDTRVTGVRYALVAADE